MKKIWLSSLTMKLTTDSKLFLANTVNITKYKINKSEKERKKIESGKGSLHLWYFQKQHQISFRNLFS